MAVTIDYNKCKWRDGGCDCGEVPGQSCCCSNNGGESSCGCEGCAEVCPTDAITREDITKVNEQLCIECGACIEACSYGAIFL